MSKGLLKTEMICQSLWERDVKLELPWMAEGNVFYLYFVRPKEGTVDGLFLVEKRLDMYDTRENGYVQRLRVRPATDADLQ